MASMLDWSLGIVTQNLPQMWSVPKGVPSSDYLFDLTRTPQVDLDVPLPNQ